MLTVVLRSGRRIRVMNGILILLCVGESTSERDKV